MLTTIHVALALPETMFEAASCSIPSQTMQWEGLEEAVDASSQHVFFKVLSPNPSLMKGIRYGYGVTPGFKSHEFVIAVLAAKRDSSGFISVSEFDGSNPHRQHIVFEFPNLGLYELQRSCYEWNTNATKFTLGGLATNHPQQHLCDQLLNDMIKARALKMQHGRSGWYYPGDDDARVECLRALEQDQLVERVGQGWLLTQAGQDRINLSHVLDKPVSRMSAGVAPLADCNTYELLGRMIQDGWAIDFVKQSELKKQPPYAVDDKVMYIDKKQHRASHSYMLALASAADIIADGHVVAIPHGGLHASCRNSTGRATYDF